MVGERFLHPSSPVHPLGVWGWCHQLGLSPQPLVWGLWVPPQGGTQGPPAPALPCSPLAPRFLRAGSCCHLLATLCPAGRRWGQRARGSWCGARDAGTVAQLRPHHGDRTKDQARTCPSSSPPSPLSPGPPPRHHPALPTGDGRDIAASSRGRPVGRRAAVGQGSSGRLRAGLEVASGLALAGGGLLWDRGVQFGWCYVGGAAAMGRSPFLPGSLEWRWRAAESLLRPLPGEKELLG